MVNENLDSWCCALSYSSHEYVVIKLMQELQKYEEMSKILQKKYKDFSEVRVEEEDIVWASDTIAWVYSRKL